MYTIFEHNRVVKILQRLPIEIRKNYVAWKRIAEVGGSQGLRLVNCLCDEH